MRRLFFHVTKAVAFAAFLAGVWYVWDRAIISTEGLILAAIGLIFVRGFSNQQQNIDGLHWRIAELARRLGHEFERDIPHDLKRGGD